MSRINNVSFNKKIGYEINLSLKELQKRTHKDYLTTKKMNNISSNMNNNFINRIKKINH